MKLDLCRTLCALRVNGIWPLVLRTAPGRAHRQANIDLRDLYKALQCNARSSTSKDEPSHILQIIVVDNSQRFSERLLHYTRHPMTQ